jgi:hypothetical protein
MQEREREKEKEKEQRFSAEPLRGIRMQCVLIEVLKVLAPHFAFEAGGAFVAMRYSARSGSCRKYGGSPSAISTGRNRYR